MRKALVAQNPSESKDAHRLARQGVPEVKVSTAQAFVERDRAGEPARHLVRFVLAALVERMAQQ